MGRGGTGGSRPGRAGLSTTTGFPRGAVTRADSDAGGCVFCAIARGAAAAHLVLDDDVCLAFLDHRPLFPGHCLLVPRAHHQTLGDLPAALVPRLFGTARLLAMAVERAFGADGTFVALNNRVSQSVPHLHVHVVPRRYRDGLRGFFWPRARYPDEQSMRDAQRAIRDAIAVVDVPDRPAPAPPADPGPS